MTTYNVNLTFEETNLIREAVKRYYDGNYDCMEESELKTYKSLLKKI